MDDEILKTLLKKATGYSRDEVQEEYGVTAEGELVLTKRKVTKKYYPPDSTALKTYLEISAGDSRGGLSDEELAAEKDRLLNELAAAQAKKGNRRRGTERPRGEAKCKGESNVED